VPQLPAFSTVELEREVLAAVDAWRLAWANRNVAAYLSAYTLDFKGDLATRAAWEKQRTERITNAKSIRLEIKDLRIRTTDASRSRVAFSQSYKSAEFSQDGEKSLFFIKVNGKWLIEREVFFAK
jgi:uncharacterized protein YchJ